MEAGQQSVERERLENAGNAQGSDSSNSHRAESERLPPPRVVDIVI